MIDILCGPSNDIRRFQFDLPPTPLKLGVFVSGGIDSALLYYMMLKLNRELGHKHTIIPYTIMRLEGSRTHALPVISYISSQFGIDAQLNIIGDNTLPEDQQVKSGILEALHKLKIDITYVGVIDQLPIHMVGWDTKKPIEGPQFKMPLANINKSHVIDLINKLGQQHLFNITHSCIYELSRCNICNGCNERSWGFAQLGIYDTGTI